MSSTGIGRRLPAGPPDDEEDHIGGHGGDEMAGQDGAEHPRHPTPAGDIVRAGWPVVLSLAWTLLGAGCAETGSSGTGAPSSTTIPPTVTTLPPASTTTSIAAVPAGSIEASLLVANPDGAFLVDGEFLFQLVEGPVARAIDDGTGGLVFQRPTDFVAREPQATIIDFLPADAFEPRELLVSTGDEYLTLWDVSAGTVWYTRIEGDTPETATETLWTYDLASRTVDQFAVTGGWEAGSIEVSVGGPNVATYWAAEAATGFDFYAESGGMVGFAGDPYQATRVCGDGTIFDTATGLEVDGPCAEYAELSEDGRLAYLERSFDGTGTRYVLVVVDLDSGEALFRQDLNRPDQGWTPATIDLLGNLVIVNRIQPGGYSGPLIEALLIDLGTGSVSQVAVPGHARFLRGPMAVD